MQTTLLSLAVGLILTLTTALVGPLFVDWTGYRAEFEAYASRISGLEIRITGPIDARLLPSPKLIMQGIEIARADEPGSIRARALRVEFELGALARGEWRVSEARLQGPEISAGLDEQGQLIGPVPKPGFGTEAIAIERLHVEDGHAVLTHAGSGSRLVLDKIEFSGELRSLSGPVKGDGSFVVAGRHFPYRIAASRSGADSAVKLRLRVDPIERPLTAEVDLTVSVDAGKPHFEGQLQFSRPVGRAPTGSQSPIIEPWRLTTRVTGDGAAAKFEDLEYQYGPDERSTKLRGQARLELGHEPRIAAELSSPQVDLDAMAVISEETRRQPLAAAKLLAEALVGAPRMPIPADLKIRIENASLAGAALQRVSMDLGIEKDRLDIRTLELRAPGATQVQVRDGHLVTMASAARFDGSVSVQTIDPRPLVAWLAAGNDVQISASAALRIQAHVIASSEEISIEGLDLDLDRMRLTGSFRYAWAREQAPPRVDVELTASEVDLDRAHALAQAVLGSGSFAWPRHAALSLKANRVLVLGVQAKQVDVKLRLDGNGLEVDPLKVADFGGTALTARGRIGTGTQSSRGAVTFEIDAHRLDGILAALDKVAPQIAEQLRHYDGRVTPAALRGSISADPSATANSFANYRFKVDGHAGPFRLALLGDLTGATDMLNLAKPTTVGAANINFFARAETDDGAALTQLLRLDRFISVDKRPGTLAVTAKGRLDGELEVNSQLSIGNLNVSTDGRLRVSLESSPRADLAIALRNVNFRSPRPAAGEHAVELLPASLSMRLAVAQGAIDLTDIKGTIAGAAVSGRVAVGLQHPFAVGGELDLGATDLPAAIATVLGIPARAGSGSSGEGLVWPSEPFAQMLDQLNGQILLSAAHLAVMPRVDVRDFKGVVRFGEGRIALEVMQGTLAGGRMSGELIFLQDGEGLIARTHVQLMDANAADLLPGDGVISGRLKLDLAAEGTGMSALALVGSLEGSGTFTLENARVARLDPRAFEILVRAVDQGLPIDPNQLRDRMDIALAGGALSIPRAEGAITITGGQARLSNSMAGARGSELAVIGTINVLDANVDARLILSSAAAADAVRKVPPEISLALKGPVSAPKRSMEVGSFANWLAVRALEQASTKLDVLEGREQGSPPANEPDQPPTDKKPRPADAGASTSAAEAARPRANPGKMHRPKPAATELRPPALLPPQAPPIPPQLLFGVQ